MFPRLPPCFVLTLAAAIFAAAPAAFAKSKPVPSPSPSAQAPAKAPAAVLHLTLRKAIALAIENNLAIKVAEFNPDIADANIMSARGAFDPTLTLQGGHDVVNSLTDESHAGSFGASLSGKTGLGTTYNLGLTGTGSEYSRYLSTSGASLAQPLLRGFGLDVNLAALRIARNNRQISEWDFKQAVMDVVTNTVYFYNELYASLRYYEAQKRSHDLAMELCKEEEARAEIGVKVELDVITAQAEAAAREEGVIVAKNTIDNNERYLKQLITCDTQTLLATRVEIEPPPDTLTSPMDVEAGLRDALRERPDYQAALVALKTKHINVVTARNATLPRLDLVASLDLLGVNSHDVADSMRFWDRNVRNPSDWSVGAIFSMPLGNREARGDLKAAKLLDAQALVGLQRLEQSIIVDVAYAAGDVNTARQRIDSTQEALRLASESLDAGRKRHDAGKATTYEVLQLQRAMIEAEASLIRAQADYRTALSEYDRRTGVTLQRNAINVTP